VTVLVLVLALLTLGTSAPAHPSPPTSEPNPVVIWNGVTDEVAITACLAPGANPLDESRLDAMVHLAIHDAVNAINPRFAGYASFGRAPGASVAAAVASAASTVLTSGLQSLESSLPPRCFERALAVVEQRYHSALQLIADGSGKRDGIAAGQNAALAILSLRANDRSDVARGSFTAWAKVRPFVLPDLNTRTPEAEPAPSTPAYALALAEVQKLGGDGFVTATLRTPAETETALFWRQSPVLSWNAVARSVASGHHLDEADSARLFGVLNVAMADSYIAAAAVLARRPSTYAVVRSAEDDGIPSTHGHPRWTPLAGADPHATHELAQTMVAASAAAVIADVLGTDQFTFSLCSRTVATKTCDAPDPALRQFGSFSRAAAENGWAQVLLGRQLGFTVDPDLSRGSRIGHLLGRTLNPLSTLALPQPCYPARPWPDARRLC